MCMYKQLAKMKNNSSMSLVTAVGVCISYMILIVVGQISDLFTYLFFYKDYPFRNKDGYVPIYSRIESLYIRKAYTHIEDCFNRPIKGHPSKYINVLDREYDNVAKKMIPNGRTIKLLNLGSYNYLGLASENSPTIEEVLLSVDDLPITLAGSLVDVGAHSVVQELEREFADFLCQEDCMVFPMGFATNTCTIPVFTGEGDLIVSDEYNHASIIYGARLSRACVKTFPHNNVRELEKTLRYWISQGQPISHKAWRRVFVLTEGIYSMEGTTLRLPEILELRKRYKFYLFIDEAHSIGAIGATGRGICEYFGVDFKCIDMLMGTFSKSFNGVGGYIAGSRRIVNFLRHECDAARYGEQLSPVVAKQVLVALRYVKSEEGRKLPAALRENSIYMRKRLLSMGYTVYGAWDSPVIPLMIFSPGKVGEFSRLCKERGLAVVIVGHPATSFFTCRARLCMSAALNKKDIDIAIRIIDEVGKTLGLKGTPPR
eukprot:jgi/Antlo1/6/2026